MNEMDFREYLAFLRDLSETLGEITKVEQEKAEFVRNDDLDGLNECMKQEQALSMTLRSYDQKRNALLTLLNLQDVPLRGLLAHAPDPYRLETKQTVEELCRQYALFRSAFEVAQDTLECNLHQVEKLLLKSEAAADVGYQEVSPQLPAPMRTDFRA